jgi:hypothetical protein
MSNNAPWQIAVTDESDLPVIGKSFKAGDYLVTCTAIEWCYMPPGDGDPVPCHSREVAEACLSHGGHVGYRGVYSTTF